MRWAGPITAPQVFGCPKPNSSKAQSLPILTEKICKPTKWKPKPRSGFQKPKLKDGTATPKSFTEKKRPTLLNYKSEGEVEIEENNSV